MIDLITCCDGIYEIERNNEMLTVEERLDLLERKVMLSNQLLFNRNQSAKVLGVSPTQFDRWRKQGKIVSTCIGKGLHWTQDDLKKFIKDNGVKGFL